MHKSQFIDTVAARYYEGDRKAAARALTAVLDTIVSEVAEGEKVSFTGFGSFERRLREARWVRNPQTGAQVRSKKHWIPKFTPGHDLKKVIAALPTTREVHEEAETHDAEPSPQPAGLDEHRVQLLLSLLKEIGAVDEPAELLRSLEGLSTADDAAVRAWLDGDGSRWIGRASRSAELWLDL